MDHGQVSNYWWIGHNQQFNSMYLNPASLNSNLVNFRSIQYSPDCTFPRRAGAEIYVIVGVVAVILLVAVAAFTWSRFRKRRELTQVPTEDSA